ncbi:MAG: YfhO family protein, partial [Clostridia bacterium]|nr:YfhO family protein [Clostridia bacterium]
YGLESLVYRKKYKLYVISLSVIMICNYYIGFMVCIFAVLYFFYCYFSKSKEEVNPHGEKLHFIRAGSRFAIFSVISATISAFMLIAALYSLQFGKTEFSSPSWSLTANFNIVDFLTKFLPGAYDTVEPSGLPFVYCGLITLLLLPVYFLSKSITSREKVSSLALIGVLVLSLFLKPLDLIWHGFSMPNWLNARYSFILCFVLLVIAYKAFGNLRETSEKFLLGTAAFIILFVAVAEKFQMESYLSSNKKLLTFGCIWFAIAFTIIITVLLCLKVNKTHKKHSRAISAILATVICAELFCNGIVCILYLNKDVGFTTYTRYYDHVNRYRPVVSAIKEQDSSFYRMEKENHRTKNDNMALGMYGLTNSTSTLNQKAIDFIADMGYVGRSHGTMYKGGTAVTDSIFGIKYLITNRLSTKHDNIYEKVESIENEYYSVYKNPNALSIAYGVSDDINELNLSDYQTFFDRYNGLLTAMLGSEERINLFKPLYNESIYFDACEEDYNSLHTKYMTSELTGSVTFDYIAPETGYYYFYTIGSATNALEVYFNNGAATEYMGKDSNHIVLAGYFEEGESIAATVTIPANTTFTRYNDYSELWYVTPDEYNELFTTLKEGPQFDISSEESTEDHLVGTISTSNEDQTILTTIPYDKGWNVYVDGERVETYETLGALMAFDIDADGDHTLEMKYWPREYTVGICISLLGLLSFIAICTVDFVLKKTLLKNKLKTYEKDYFVLADYDSDDVDLPAEPLLSNLSHDEEEIDASEDEPTSDDTDSNEEN